MTRTGSSGGRPTRIVSPTPNRGALFRWLCDFTIVDDGGRVWSWENPAHRGYPYPEAAALWLSWAAWRSERADERPADEQVSRVARWLVGALAEGGAVGRKEERYLFDTCLAVFALARWGYLVGGARRGGAPAGVHPTAGLVGMDPEALGEASMAGLHRFLRAGSPVLPAATGSRWSTRWGPHLYRAAGFLWLTGLRFGWDEARELALEIRTRCAAAPLSSTPAYLHALAYAVEGDLIFSSCGHQPHLDVGRCAELLARVQHAEGPLPAWSDGSGGARADATGQAIRIWSTVDGAHFREPIQRALGWLAACQSPGGGLPYGHGSTDMNSWAAIFADQAVAWATGSRRGGWL